MNRKKYQLERTKVHTPNTHGNSVCEKNWENLPSSKLTQNNHQTDKRLKRKKSKVIIEKVGEIFTVSERGREAFQSKTQK